MPFIRRSMRFVRLVPDIKCSVKYLVYCHCFGTFFTCHWLQIGLSSYQFTYQINAENKSHAFGNICANVRVLFFGACVWKKYSKTR